MQTFRNRFGWALAGALALVLIATLAREIQAGPLDPPGPVGSTMKTLADLVPAWHQTLSSSGGCSSQRFSCVMGGTAVLDNETGLVWQKTPSSAAGGDWASARSTCTSATTGNREGWRLPGIDELVSLRDAAAADGLPGGHPFVGAGGHYYWSATAAPADDGNAQYALFDLGGTTFTAFKEIAVAGAWCVRGSNPENAEAPADVNSWSRALSASGLDSCHSPRFTCVMADQAVLDRNTGLVWTRSMYSPATPGINAVVPGDDSGVTVCANDETGGLRGWRMPTAAELESLYDPSGAASGGWALPNGHPFIVPSNANTDHNVWWTATKSSDGTYRAYVRFHEDVPNVFPPEFNWYVVGVSAHVWCVRGSSAP